MSDKKYPYIGRSAQGNKYVVVSGCLIYSLLSKSWLHEADGFAPMDNITREYLANTCGEVKDERHAEFIKALAEVNGINSPNPCGNWYADRYFCFHPDINGNMMLGFYRESSAKSNGEKLITIPQPPEGWNMQTDNDEWPKVGDEVLISGLQNDSRCIDFEGESVTIASKSHINGVDVVTFYNTLHGYGALAVGDHFKKPKTPEQNLRDELFEYFNEVSTSARYAFAGNEIVINELLEKYNITKKEK